MSAKKYSYAVGRRKSAVAQVRLFAGKGESTINGKAVDGYVHRADLFHTIYAPLKTAGVYDGFHFEAKVSGSGEASQAEAIRHGMLVLWWLLMKILNKLYVDQGSLLVMLVR